MNKVVHFVMHFLYITFSLSRSSTEGFGVPPLTSSAFIDPTPGRSQSPLNSNASLVHPIAIPGTINSIYHIESARNFTWIGTKLLHLSWLSLLTMNFEFATFTFISFSERPVYLASTFLASSSLELDATSTRSSPWSRSHGIPSLASFDTNRLW
jgi:hypothetical protein